MDKREILEKLNEAENKIIELEKSNKLYQSLAGLVSDYVFKIDLDSDEELPVNILGKSRKYSEDKFYKVLGYTPSELKTSEIFDRIIHHDDLDSIHDFRQKVLSGHQTSYKCRIFTKSGEITWWKGTGKPVMDKNNQYVIGAVITANNITKNKRIEMALKENEEKFRELFNKANDMIALIELGENGQPRRFLEVNDATITILGYSRKELLEMKIKEIIHPKYRSQMAKNANDLKKNMHITFEIAYMTKWSSKIPVEVSTHICKLNEKDIILAISRDIRERKQAEKQLEKLVEDLKSSNCELKQFIYSAYHDLQEPLRTVASYTQLIAHRYKDKLDSDANDFINYAVNGAIRMQQIIQDLIEYSSVIADGGEFKSVNLEKALNNVIFNLSVAIENSNAKITNDPLPTITADKKQIVQLFQNLIENAIKFKKENESPEIHISVSEDYKNNEHVFKVIDNGIGLEPQYAKRIFVIFQKLHTLDKYPGSGIGLAVSKRIIKRHGGHIWVKSEPQRGATFYFTIPYDIEHQKIVHTVQNLKNENI